MYFSIALLPARFNKRDKDQNKKQQQATTTTLSPLLFITSFIVLFFWFVSSFHNNNHNHKIYIKQPIMDLIKKINLDKIRNVAEDVYVV